VLRYLLSPTAVAGTNRPARVEFARTRLLAGGTIEPTGETESIDAGLVLTSIGYRGVPLPDLPFDPATGTVPNDRGRVLDPGTGAPLAGTFVTGWIKRGPTGFLGTNRSCAQETVRMLVEDWSAGRLAWPRHEPRRQMLPQVYSFAP
jgi:ferredoxin--NADP+ reductase